MLVGVDEYLIIFVHQRRNVWSSIGQSSARSP